MNLSTQIHRGFVALALCAAVSAYAASRPTVAVGDPQEMQMFGTITEDLWKNPSAFAGARQGARDRRRAGHARAEGDAAAARDALSAGMRNSLRACRERDAREIIAACCMSSCTNPRFRRTPAM